MNRTVVDNQQFVAIEALSGHLHAANLAATASDEQAEDAVLARSITPAGLDDESFAAELRRPVEDPGLVGRAFVPEHARGKVVLRVEVGISVLVPVDPLERCRLAKAGAVGPLGETADVRTLP